jgi:hypothetical protein
VVERSSGLRPASALVWRAAAGEVGECRGRLGMAWLLYAYYGFRLRQNKGIVAISNFVQDVLLSSARAIKENSTRLLELSEKASIEDLVGSKEGLERMQIFSPAEEEKRAKTHSLPSLENLSGKSAS